MTAATASTMPLDGAAIQSLVLQAPRAGFVRHLLIGFPKGARQRHRALSRLLAGEGGLTLTTARRGDGEAPTARARQSCSLHLGFTFRGLQLLGMRRQGLPGHLERLLRVKAPAFCAGAARRAPTHLGDTGASAPKHWLDAFGTEALEWVITLHGPDRAEVEQATSAIESQLQPETPVPDGKPGIHALDGERLPPEPGEGPNALYMHFGYRDGLSQLGIRGWSRPERPLHEGSWHQPGEFVLGHPQDSGANPWMHDGLGARPRVLPQEVRSFFADGSFGVLRVIRQDVWGFEDFVTEAAQRLPEPMKRQMPGLPDRRDYVKAKLCGRWPDGRLIDPGGHGRRPEDPRADFDYASDAQGHGCPFGAHTRRLNPRDTDMVNLRRPALVRRGMPYGPPRPQRRDEERQPEPERGLLGLFFCASIESQFEHLLGGWADRVPMTNPDRGNAKDPLIGEHEDPASRFEIPQPGASHFIDGWRPFTQTRGTAYLFYPSARTCQGLANSQQWLPETAGEDE